MSSQRRSMQSSLTDISASKAIPSSEASLLPPRRQERSPGWLDRLGTDRAIVLSALLIAVVGFFATEKIGVNRGLGWDGAVYAEWVQDFPGTIQKGMDSYRVQRILPAAVAHYCLRLFKDSIQERHVIRAFGIINILGTVLVAWFWCKIAEELKISDRGKWLGFAGLILNFAITKNAFFYPVLMDVSAMAISTAMCYCYLRGWQFRLLGMIGLGAFTWPTLIYIGAVLVLFPRRPAVDAQVGAAPWRLNFIFAGLAAYYVGLWTVYILRDIQGPVFGWLAPIESVLPLSIALLLGYLFFGLASALNNDRLFQPARYWTKGNGPAVLCLICVVVAIKLTQAELSVRPFYIGPETYFLTVGVASVAKPAVFFVAATIYFGPLLLLAVFSWRSICRLVHQHGMGLTLAVAIGLAHNIDSESRHCVYVIPLLFPFIVKAVDGLGWRREQYGLIVVLAAISTKAWLTIEGTFQGNTFLYPDQLYTMHHGPFMGDAMYLAHLGGIGVAALVIYIVCFQQRRLPLAAATPVGRSTMPLHAEGTFAQSRSAA